MELKNIPQDQSKLSGFTKELSYATDENGKYTAAKSAGWEVKTTALDTAWSDIEKRIEEAKQKVIQGTASPVLYFMELKLMDLTIIAAYTGFWQWQIKRHMKMEVFQSLSDKKLKRYAELFEVTLETLKKPF